MSLADELAKLDDLHSRGALSDAEFQQAKQRLMDDPGPAAAAADAVNRFRRSRSDRWIGGVCGGLAEATHVDSWIWRLVLTILLIFGGSGLVVSVLLWIFVPDA